MPIYLIFWDSESESPFSTISTRQCAKCKVQGTVVFSKDLYRGFPLLRDREGSCTTVRTYTAKAIKPGHHIKVTNVIPVDAHNSKSSSDAG